MAMCYHPSEKEVKFPFEPEFYRYCEYYNLKPTERNYKGYLLWKHIGMEI